MTFVWDRAGTSTNFAGAAPAFSYAKLNSRPPGVTFYREIIMANWVLFVDASSVMADYSNAPWTAEMVHAIVQTHGSPTAPFPTDPRGNPPTAQDYLWRQGMSWCSDWNNNLGDFTQFRSPVDGRPIDTRSRRNSNATATETALWYVWHVQAVALGATTFSWDLTLTSDILVHVP